MTMPFERTRAVVGTEEFLRELLNREKHPEITDATRGQINWCLRHYPSKSDINIVARGWGSPSTVLMQCPFSKVGAGFDDLPDELPDEAFDKPIAEWEANQAYLEDGVGDRL